MDNIAFLRKENVPVVRVVDGPVWKDRPPCVHVQVTLPRVANKIILKWIDYYHTPENVQDAIDYARKYADACGYFLKVEVNAEDYV